MFKLTLKWNNGTEISMTFPHKDKAIAYAKTAIAYFVEDGLEKPCNVSIRPIVT